MSCRLQTCVRSFLKEGNCVSEAENSSSLPNNKLSNKLESLHRPTMFVPCCNWTVWLRSRLSSFDLLFSFFQLLHRFLSNHLQLLKQLNFSFVQQLSSIFEGIRDRSFCTLNLGSDLLHPLANGRREGFKIRFWSLHFGEAFVQLWFELRHDLLKSFYRMSIVALHTTFSAYYDRTAFAEEVQGKGVTWTIGLRWWLAWLITNSNNIKYYIYLTIYRCRYWQRCG